MSIFLTGVFFACKKDKNESPQPSTPAVTIPKIKTETDSLDNSTTTYFYNSAGKVYKILYHDGSYDTVIYAANSITVKGYKINPLTLSYEMVFNLNNKGLATSAWQINYNGSKKTNNSLFKTFLFNNSKTSKTNDTITIQYFYNTNDNMIKAIYNNNDTITFNYDNIGNLISTVSYGYTINYEYYTDKTNTIGYYNFGIYFLGKDSKNLVKSEIHNTYTRNFNYTFDSNNRVSKKRQITSNYQNTTTYTYY
jgi:hypothetical protein